MDKEDDLQGFEDPMNSHLSLSGGRRHSFGASGCLTDDFLESVNTLNKDKSNSTDKLKKAHEEELKFFKTPPRVKRQASKQSMPGLLADVYNKKTLAFQDVSEHDEDEESDENGNLLLSEKKKSTSRKDELEEESDEDEGPAWDSKFQYLLALLGWAVGLGNIWRFPFLCWKHGGGAFLIPYTVLLIFEAFPLFFLELLFGQVHRVGSVKLWFKFDKRALGIGCASAVTCLLIALYYNVILAWAAIYLGTSFSKELPWADCPTINGTPVPECAETSPTEYYYYRNVLDFSGWGEEGSNDIVTKVLVSNVVVWGLVFISCVKGISSAGKAMYVTVIFPIVVLTIFFFRSITLRGASGAIGMVFTPDISKAFKIGAWKDAAIQTFFNLGLAYGTVISYSSFNPRKNNCQKDAIFVATANYFVSIIASMTVFGIVGFKALSSTDRCILGKLDDNELATRMLPVFGVEAINRTTIETVTDVMESKAYAGFEDFKNCSQDAMLSKFQGGPGLAFIAFAEAVTKLPFPQLWSVLFFGMILMVGISSQIGILLGFLLPIHDTFLQKKIKQSYFTAGSCVTLMLVGVIFCLRSGIQWLDIFDSNASTIPLLVIAFHECIMSAVVYGIEKIREDIKSALDYIPMVQPFWDICWKLISPVLLGVIIGFSFYDLFTAPVKVSYWDSMTFTGPAKASAPSFSIFCLYLILLTPLMMIPIQFALQTIKLRRRRAYKEANNNNNS